MTVLTIQAQTPLYAVIGLRYGDTSGQNFKVPDLPLISPMPIPLVQKNVVIVYSIIAALTVTMAQATITINRQTTAVTPHSNVSPYLALNYCICVDGYFPIHGN